VFDLDRGTDTPLTFTGGWAVRSAWSPDGRRFAVTRFSRDGGPIKVMIGSADGLSAPDSITVPERGMFVSQWSAAGSRLVGYSNDVHPLVANMDGGDHTVRPLLDPAELMANPQISPDGRWVAGVMRISDILNVFVRNLEGPPGRWQISSGLGGAKPYWTKGGKELLFESTDGKVMAVDIDTRSGFHAGLPHLLFPLPILSYGREISTWAPDSRGERFVVLSLPQSNGAGRPIEVVTDFRPLVERK
jgi:Tol biopolymer transport system component